MRLDTHLVEEKLVATRSRAQRAIKRGFVTVNGKTVVKPSQDVTRPVTVKIDTAADKLGGYWKLKDIQNLFALIKPRDIVLDIGSSAGGFLSYSAELAARVYAVEFSLFFKPSLDSIAQDYPNNVYVIYADAFSFDFASFGLSFDVILNDVTAEPADSLKLLEKSVVVLKKGGRVLQVLKGKVDKGALENHKARIEDCNLKIQGIVTSHKKELYVVAEKWGSTNAEEGI